MAGLGYQAVQPANFDMTDIIQRQQAMEMEGAAMQARRAAAEAAKQKGFDKLEIQTPNRMHNALVTNWAMALMQEKKDIMGIADVNERAARTAEWNDKKQELAAFSNMSKEWGNSLSSIDKDVSTNKSKYTVEGINDYGKRLEQYQKDLISRASIRNGTLYIDDNPWTTSPNSIFTDIAPPETAQESFYFNFIETFGKGVFDEQPADYRVFNQQKFNDTFEQAKAEAAKVGGSIKEIEATKDALFSYYSHDPQKVRGTDGGDGQGGGSDFSSQYKTTVVEESIPAIEKADGTKIQISGGKKPKALTFSYVGKSANEPTRMFTFTDIATGNTGTYNITIDNIYQTDESQFLVVGSGYAEEEDMFGMTEITGERPIKGRQPVRFFVNKTNKRDIENTYFNGTTLEEKFAEQPTQQTQTTTQKQNQTEVKTIKRSDIASKAKAAGYTVSDYTKALLDLGVKIID